MPATSPRKGKSRHSDPSNASITPLTAGFSRISTSSRTQSLSPRKKDAKQGLHIRMNLTETQMDKVTNAFTRSIDRNPAKVSDSSTPEVTMRSHQPSSSRQHPMETAERDTNQPIPTEFEDKMPLPPQRASTMTLAERRQRSTPAPIRIVDARHFVNAVPRRSHMESVPNVMSPLNPREIYNAGRGPETQSSFYPSTLHTSQRPEPLNIRRSEDHHVARTPDNPFETFGEWLPRPRSEDSPPKELHRSKSAAVGLESRHREASTSPEKEGLDLEINDTPAFSPFPYYFRGEDFPSQRMGQKTLIGEGGWLERTDECPDKSIKGAKKGGFINGIKRLAKDITDQYHPGRFAYNEKVDKECLKAGVTVTLNAREQSLLYCELEFNLCNSLNDFIKIQFDKGRVDTDKLKKIGDAWMQKGRPRVVGFRYDLETQLELIELHIGDFVFSGRRQGNPTEIAALLYAMKVNARTIRVRTFCHPDSVIAKQLVDSQSLFNLIGSPAADNYALEECAQFYKICMQREAARQTKETKTLRMAMEEGHAFHKRHRPKDAKEKSERAGRGNNPY